MYIKLQEKLDMESIIFTVLFLLAGLHMISRGKNMEERAKKRANGLVQKHELFTAQGMKGVGYLFFLFAALTFLSVFS